MKAKYTVIDIETSIKNRGEEAVGKFKASPFNPKNNIVMVGWKSDVMRQVSTDTARVAPYQQELLLVGHNIGFDLLYLMRDKGWRAWLSKGRIWDTMIAEYLLTGQQSKFASLDTCSEKYGGTIKDDKIKEYWNSDVDTEDIPQVELEEYLKHDVINTEIVFLAQLEKAKELNMLPLIFSQMEAKLATVEMEYNGMYMDTVSIDAESLLLQSEIEHLDYELSKAMRPSFPMEVDDINPMSSQQLGLYLFGGSFQYKAARDQYHPDGKPIIYKTGARKGEQKTKIETTVVTIKGKMDGTRFSHKSTNGWSTSEEVLKNIINSSIGLPPAIRTFCINILRLRQLNKDYRTYFVGYKKLLWPTDSCIHATFNHTKTDTGRLSCSSPNLQQLTH